jgi:hypothetical protein
VLAAVLAVALLAPPALAGTLVLQAARDATLIESSDGSLANGAGPAFFVGRTSQSFGARRRAVLSSSSLRRTHRSRTSDSIAS